MTKAADWPTLRAAPAPWGEMGSSKFIITTQRAGLMALADPVALMKYWDKVRGWRADEVLGQGEGVAG